jgi:hypothetical protein
LAALDERRREFDWVAPVEPPDITAMAGWLTRAFSRLDRRVAEHFSHVIADEHGPAVRLAVWRCCQVMWRRRLH